VTCLAYVASTLPFNFLLRICRDTAVVIACPAALCTSYRYLERIFPAVSVRPVPNSRVLAAMFLLWRMALSRRVMFFHECCAFIFDLLLLVTRRTSEFHPMVTLDGFRTLSDRETSFAGWTKYFASNVFPLRVVKAGFCAHLTRQFEFLETTADGGDGKYRVARLRVESLPFIQSNRPRFADTTTTEWDEAWPGICGLHKSPGEKVLLLICAREPIPDQIQIAAYNQICDVAERIGYKVFIKDHPREVTRLEFDRKGAVVVDPNLPTAVIAGFADVCVGSFSTALVEMHCPPVSVGHLLGFPNDALRERTRHLTALSGCSRVVFPQSFSELEIRLRDLFGSSLGNHHVQR
jgi:hypothetical protein